MDHSKASLLKLSKQHENTGVYAGIASSWSFDQLSYELAFKSGDFGGASALSIILLVPSLIGALVVIFKTDMFDDKTIRTKKDSDKVEL
jgi:multiple sugar transport system permease protein